jgi:glycerophosphoryl diester phosphodiesterase
MLRLCAYRFLPFIFILFACKRDDALFPIENLNDNRIGIFGHGGMGNKYRFPINSYQSINEVLEVGVDGSEMDLQITKDSVLVLLHNTFLEEITKEADGLVYEKNWHELEGSKVKSLSTERVDLLRFEDLLDKLKASGKNLNSYTLTLDCKLHNGSANRDTYLRQFANSLLQAVDRFGLSETVFIESTDSTFLRQLLTRRPKLKLFIYTSQFEESLAIAKFMRLYGITMNTNLISANQVKLAHQQGQRVTLWAVENKSDNMKAIRKSPDFIQSDNPRHLQRVLK